VNILYTKSSIEEHRIGEEFMSYCPKCGNKVDDTMTFCPNCGTSLKIATSQAASTPVTSARTRQEKQEKQEKQERQEKQEKGEKHEKGQHGFAGWMIAGLILVFFGFVAYTNLVYHWVPSGPEASALWLVAIGIIIIVVGVYFATRARRNFPATI
jgi:Flp pilus assembly protein TadB